MDSNETISTSFFKNEKLSASFVKFSSFTRFCATLPNIHRFAKQFPLVIASLLYKAPLLLRENWLFNQNSSCSSCCRLTQEFVPLTSMGFTSAQTCISLHCQTLTNAQLSLRCLLCPSDIGKGDSMCCYHLGKPIVCGYPITITETDLLGIFLPHCPQCLRLLHYPITGEQG